MSNILPAFLCFLSPIETPIFHIELYRRIILPCNGSWKYTVISRVDSSGIQAFRWDLGSKRMPQISFQEKQMNSLRKTWIHWAGNNTTAHILPFTSKQVNCVLVMTVPGTESVSPPSPSPPSHASYGPWFVIKSKYIKHQLFQHSAIYKNK